MGKPKIYIINGPNLKLVGEREKERYGVEVLDDFLQELKNTLKDECELELVFSNHCGEIIDLLHSIRKEAHGIVLNAGGYTHTSVALGDAVKAISAPVIEVHITNIYARESYRTISHISKGSDAVISGMGLYGYEAAVHSLLRKP